MTENSARPTVLIVDDEPLIRWSLSAGLDEAGYHVEEAGTGADALAALAAIDGRPLVVLLDLRLPDVADLSLAARIRAARPDAPVIMMTAHGTQDDVDRALALGVYRVVGKPFDVAAMVGLVDRAADAGHEAR